MSNKKNWYFTKVHEDAIVEYAQNKDVKVRTDLYVNLIEPVFNELINNIVFTYKFHDLPNIDSLKQECKIWLTTILDKFDPNKGSKAFNYFTVVVRNWFIQKAKKRSRTLRDETNYDDLAQSLEEEYLSVENPYEASREKEEFFDLFKMEMESWDKGFRGRLFGENDIKVLEAIRTIFENVEEIEVYTKKGIYVYLREITGLNTKQITRSVKKLKDRYDVFRKDWDNHNVEER